MLMIYRLRFTITLPHRSKLFRQHFAAKRKNLTQFLANQPHGHSTQQSKGQRIMHQILHFDAALNLTKFMLVMPKAIRAKTLLVNKKMWLSHLRNLSDPPLWNIQKWRQAIADEHAGIHFIRKFRDDFKAQSRWRYLAQIVGIGKKRQASAIEMGKI